MIDIKLLREKPEVIKEALRKRGVEVDVDYLRELDQRIRALKKEIDDLRRKRNEISKKAKNVPEKIEEAKKIKEELKKKEEEIAGLQKEFNSVFLLIPNIPLEDTPAGEDESDNIVVEKWGEPKKFNFKIKDHLELGELWDLIDVKRAAKISGSRFG
ncbi:serine--tRNA ligase, partial [bacterium]|nr:serine--tRNA ligase [bacterium]